MTPQSEDTHYAFSQSDDVGRALTKCTVNNSAAYLKSALEPHMRILDVGCGPGSITIDLAKRVVFGHVIGVDTEVAVVTLEKARAQAA